MVLSSSTTLSVQYCSPNSKIATKIQVESLQPLLTPPPSPKKKTKNGHPVTISCFRNWKKHLSGTGLLSNSDIKTAAEKWLNGHGCDLYQAGFNKLFLCSDKSLNKLVIMWISDRQMCLFISFCVLGLLLISNFALPLWSF